MYKSKKFDKVKLKTLMFLPVYIHNLHHHPKILVLILQDLFLEYVKRIYNNKDNEKYMI